MRFLEPSPELMYLTEPSNATTVVKEFGASADDEEFYLQEMILARYAKRLLQQKNLQKLLHFSRLVRRELHVWLQRERFVFNSIIYLYQHLSFFSLSVVEQLSLKTLPKLLHFSSTLSLFLSTRVVPDSLFLQRAIPLSLSRLVAHLPFGLTN